MGNRTCRIQVEFDRYIHKNIRQYRSSKSYAKTLVINFFGVLIDEGYRHFVLYIDYPGDLWVAEILYFLIPSYKPLNITYSLGLWTEENCTHYTWMEYSGCLVREVLQTSKKIIWRQDGWYEPEYDLKILRITRRN